MKKRWKIAAFAAGVLAVTMVIALAGGGLGRAMRENSYSYSSAGDGYWVEETAAAAPAMASGKMAANASYTMEEAAYDWEAADSYGMNAYSESGSYDDGYDQSVMNLNADGEQKNYAGKLIKTVSVEIETSNYDALANAIREKTAALGGYIESSNEYSNYNSRRSGYLSVRVPQDKLDEFLNTALTDGTITSRSEYVEDVTLTYSDIEARVSTLKVEQERLLELLAKADNIESIIALESRLSDISYQLEEYASRLRVYDNMVSYSTVSISLEEVVVEAPKAKATLGERIVAGITENIIEIASFAGALLYLLVINIPTMIVVAVLGGILILICKLVAKMFRRKRTSKKDAGKVEVGTASAATTTVAPVKQDELKQDAAKNEEIKKENNNVE